MHLSKESSTQTSNDESLYIVRAAFFKANNLTQNQQLRNKLASLSEQEQITQQSLILQQKYFQYQYERLKNICENIKNDTRSTVASIPVLDQQLWEPAVNSLNLITSATDSLLKEAAECARSHRNDSKTLKLLTDDLEATSNLLSSPSAQTMEVFQKRTNERYGQNTLERVGEKMQMVSIVGMFFGVMITCIAAAVICMSFGLGSIPFLLITMSGPLVSFGICMLGTGLASIGESLKGPENSSKNTIAKEVSQYIPLSPGLSLK